MPIAQTLRPALLAGRFTLLVLLLASSACFAIDSNPGELLKRADSVKTANNSEFQDLLKQLDAESAQQTPVERDYLAYLHGWQSAFRGNYEASERDLQAVVDRTQDPTIRARALITLLNSQALGSHFDKAYANLSKLLESLPQIKDPTARNYSLGVAGLLYNQAGQYDLAIKYADLWLETDSDPGTICKATSVKAEALYHLGKLAENDPLIAAGVQACRRIGDLLFANGTRIWLVALQLDHGHVGDALKLLIAHDAEVLATHSSATISKFRSLLARAYLLDGDLDKASAAAQSAIDNGIKQTYSESVADAYSVLYQIAKKQGDDKAALDWYEKYAPANKGYLSDISARALAYQKVHQQVLDSERQLAAANDANKLLTLQQQVESQKARARLLYMLLLLSGLLIVGGWAYRTKRSQIKFQKLARRDSLTGIANRQHFFDTAQDVLRYGARNSREASVLTMDLDHFKSVNDMHGHAAGDDALKRAVAACQVLLRSIDIFGRLGGEEFAILLPDCPTAVARQRAEQMRESIAASRREGDAAADVLVTASFGVAGTQDCGYNLTTLLAAADDAMYAAKLAGRNRVEVHRTLESAATT
ncbi:MAG TPA: GGDEF domain-containing protein [Rudaea sp.]|nr:GGDEF domain-containing protein [Rudaea sp.]